MNDCCEHNDKCRWAVGSNMPGCMPDGDVAHLANWQDAIACLIEDCERALDEVDNPQCYKIERRALERWAKQARAREKSGERSLKIGDYLYWVCRM